jgi:hypothetical protein
MGMKEIRRLMSGGRMFSRTKRIIIVWFFQRDYKARIALKAAIDEGVSPYLAICDMVWGN